MVALINLISAWAIPVLIAFIPLFAFSKKVPVYESFVDGAKEGFNTAVQIIPSLVDDGSD
ncbi:spore maturation protein B [Paenibacillus pini JCM 16418]|uniref:Spore maturation protein B n=1 Tax=Paenibacillus pini JCM 16418 TaxID=1236976 RepID=W7YWG8_9BACL|nr:spore maturation protein B [Paenibacillus pini JCM 16418]